MYGLLFTVALIRTSLLNSITLNLSMIILFLLATSLVLKVETCQFLMLPTVEKTSERKNYQLMQQHDHVFLSHYAYFLNQPHVSDNPSCGFTFPYFQENNS